MLYHVLDYVVGNGARFAVRDAEAYARRNDTFTVAEHPMKTIIIISTDLFLRATCSKKTGRNRMVINGVACLQCKRGSRH